MHFFSPFIKFLSVSYQPLATWLFYFKIKNNRERYRGERERGERERGRQTDRQTDRQTESGGAEQMET